MLPEHRELDIETFSRIFEGKRITNSYKFYWFKGILEETKLNNTVISFSKLTLWMICESWHTVLRYKLSLGKQDRLPQIIKEINKKHEFGAKKNKYELMNDFEKVRKSDIKKLSQNIILEDFYRYVPRKLQSPFEEEGGNTKKIYKIKEENKIEIDEVWFDYFISNYPIIKGWWESKLIDFLQTRNPNVPAIPFKLNLEKERSLKHAREYWTEIINLKGNINEIYENKSIKISDNFCIDHFIPWSFVLHDKIWNLIPTIKVINSKKSNKLPEIDKYFDKFCEFHFKHLKIAQNNNLFTKKNQHEIIKEQYQDLFSFKLDNLNKKDLMSDMKNAIIPLNQIALNSGFGVWKK